MAEQKSPTIRQWIDNVKPVATWILIVAILFQYAWSPFAHFVLFPSGVLQAISGFTWGILHQTFLAYVIMALITGFFVCYLGGLRAKDFAIIKNKLLPAIGYIIAAWLLIQITPLLAGHSFEIQASWSEDGFIARKFSRFFSSQLFGNALYEELFYRGLLISQFALLFRKKCSMTVAIILAVISSSIIFALGHIPHRIVNGLPLAGSIARVFFYGLVFASFFLLTKNIFATAGLHALWNASPNLFEHSVNRFGTYGLLMILVSILLCNFIYSKYNREPQVE